ncbi:N-acetylmuramoyl-L-alanine amidase family protein [Sedimentibacter sp. MB31-C6]|uniref:N-acetylmuramoyl-L-alanine amidase family protein n=1 Tax=Sedimentibacter sp. MB31-C6 TaxID=3109366 RepID=UPI002DDD4B38|nr:N-acetylmuramoyl-L-alanine amidase [Sedimentibacter sp. MB36-C1]WSI03581.1 N-acetylmuramoyl-L-alanine amidase [Sedimentibacter sp. MB36-C1]
MIKVMIDPGHAPGNANKGPTGYYEYQGVWKISTYLKEILQAKGMQADFSRTWDENPEPFARGQKAKGYNLFISEHTNAYNGTVRGVEVYYDYNKPQDDEFANKLASSVASVMGNTNRGAKTRVYTESGIIYNYYGVIRGAAATDCKHILLVENGFHDNEQDEAFLKINENLRIIAQTQAKVIYEYLNMENLTVQEAEKIIQSKTGIDDNTMQYLKFYKFNESLLLKLAKAMK